MQFRRGSTVFGQVVGASANSGMNFDVTGGSWRWRSALNDDNSTRMLLDTIGLAVTGRYSTASTVLEPFTSTQPTTNGVQIAFGASSSWRATFGTRYSGGEAFMAHNARQTATQTDQWEQTTPGSEPLWDSLGIFLSGSPSGSFGGFRVKRASTGAVPGSYGTFWSDIFTISLGGNITTTGTSILLNNVMSNLIQFRTVGDALPSLTARSEGTKIVLWPSFTSGSAADYALGIGNGALWMTVAGSGSLFRWYGGNTEWMRLYSTGLSLYSGNLYLGSASPNLIRFNNVGVEPPEFTNRSDGTKIVLYSAVSGSSVDYALGIDSSTLWFSTTNSGSHFKWYGGTSLMMTLMGGSEKGSLVLGPFSDTGGAALPTNATNGFLYIRSMNGEPTGTPTTYSGTVPMVYDTASHRLCIYDGGWREVTLTPIP